MTPLAVACGLVVVCWLAGFADRLHSDAKRPNRLVRFVHALAIATFLPIMGAVYLGDWCGRQITGGGR